MFRPLAQRLSRNSTFLFRSLVQRNSLKYLSTDTTVSDTSSSADEIEQPLEDNVQGMGQLQFKLPINAYGIVVGRHGINAKLIEFLTSCRINVDNDNDGSAIKIIGDSGKSQVQEAKKYVDFLLGILEMRNTESDVLSQYSELQETINVPSTKVGIVIGSGAQTKNVIELLSRCYFQFGESSRTTFNQCPVTLFGEEENRQKAKEGINHVIKCSELFTMSPYEPCEGEKSAALVISSRDIGTVLGKRGAMRTALEILTGCRICLGNPAQYRYSPTMPVHLIGDEEKLQKGLEILENFLEMHKKKYTISS